MSKHGKHTVRHVIMALIIAALCGVFIKDHHVVGSIFTGIVVVIGAVTELILHFVHDAERHHAANKAAKSQGV